MRHRVAERLELTVDGGQRSRPLLNQLFELSAIPPQLLLGLVELHEHGYLGPHDGGDHWGEDEVDRSEIVAPTHVDLGVVERGDEDDRGHLRSRSLTNQSGGLEAVHPRHPHVEQDDREVLLQELAQGVWAGSGFDDVLTERGQDCLHRETFGGVVVHEQDVHLGIGGGGARGHRSLRGHWTSLNTRTASRTCWYAPRRSLTG